MTSASADDPIQQFILSPSGTLALTMVTNKFSSIRKEGDAVAHESRLDPTKYGSVIERHVRTPAVQAALRDLVTAYST